MKNYSKQINRSIHNLNNKAFRLGDKIIPKSSPHKLKRSAFHIIDNILKKSIIILEHRIIMLNKPKKVQ